MAVFAAPGRGDRATLAAVRLYLPQEWCADAARCARAGIPEEARVFKTKAVLALELILHRRGSCAAFEPAVMAADYGKEPALRRALDDARETLVAGVHRSHGSGPQTHGRPRLWHLPARRALGQNGQPEEISRTLSNAPADIPAVRLVPMACGRFFIARGFQDAKTSLGLADYQTRGWRAWHHHMALVMLAMLFQLRERMMHAEERPQLSWADVVELLRQLELRHRKRPASMDSAAAIQVPLVQVPDGFR